MAPADNSFIALAKIARASANSRWMKVPAGAREMVLTLDANQPAATVTIDAKAQWTTDSQANVDAVTAWAKDVTTGAFTQVTSAAASQQILLVTGFAPGGWVRILSTVVNTPNPTFGVQIAFR